MFLSNLTQFAEISEQNRVYLFNVGPWEHVRELGSAGKFRIPPCPAGKEYSAPVVIDGIEEEPYPINETSCVMIPKAGKPGQLSGPADGTLLAQQVLGEGPHVAPNSSFRPFGVGITKQWPPSKVDLDKARAALHTKKLELVRLANEAYARGPRAFDEIFMPDWHFWAAHQLKKSVAECPWLANTQEVAAREYCPSCGESYQVGIMRHSCGFILDKKRYDQAVKDGLFS